jgi:hypothetical protein
MCVYWLGKRSVTRSEAASEIYLEFSKKMIGSASARRRCLVYTHITYTPEIIRQRKFAWALL